MRRAEDQTGGRSFGVAAVALVLSVPLCVRAPMALLAQCPDGTPPPCGGRPARVSAPAPTSVAVLYFDNLSRDTADAYLADGLTEELTSRLGDIERLRVTGRTAVRRAQQQAAGDFAAIGRSLGVRYLVEGSVRRAGQTVRVSVRLLRASDGVRIWGDTYDRTMTDILALEGAIAGEVVTNVAGRLLPGERTALTARPTTDPRAYDHYLRGNYFIVRRSPTALRQAAAEFDQALRADPSFVGAEARRAIAYALGFAQEGAAWAPAESLAAWATHSAERALRLDSMSADAWLARGDVDLWFRNDPLHGRAALERAVALDPRNAEAVHALGVVLRFLREDSLADREFRAALALDPARAVELVDLAMISIIAHRLPEALRLLDSALALDPELLRGRPDRALVRLALGDVAAARRDADEGIRLGLGTLRGRALSIAAMVDAADGDSAAARARVAVIDTLEGPSLNLARALLAVGARDSAITVLERARHAGLARDWFFLQYPEFDVLRSSPRFQRVFAQWRPAGAAR